MAQESLNGRSAMSNLSPVDNHDDQLDFMLTRVQNDCGAAGDINGSPWLPSTQAKVVLPQCDQPGPPNASCKNLRVIESDMKFLNVIN